MARASSLPLIFTFLICLSSLPTPSHSSEDFLYGGCTRQRYAPDSPYETNLNSVLASLTNSATYSSYHNDTILGSSPEDVIYGQYQCRGDLSMPDCAACVARAVSQLGAMCSQTCGGALQLQGCYLKYDNTTFLGVEDKSVVFKKCGPSVGYDTDTVSLRDAVLDELGRISGPYRVSGSEEVRGVAQCVGDLSVGECQDCLSEAIGRLKTECGTADYGDMFLAKCYVRFSTGEHRVYAKTHDNGTDEGEKTFAILVGLLAGVALLVIFLIFLRNVCEGSGK